MKIKLGEYVRTDEGYIGKLVEINKENINYYKIDVGREIRRKYYKDDNYIYSRDGFGLKHSSNIIDLIEEGDYVNGYKVEKIEEVPNKMIGKVVVLDTDNVGGYDCYAEEIRKEDIKSIVTKEQFNSISYVLEE